MSATKRLSQEKSVPKRPKYALKVEVEGPGVHTKSIAIPDLLKICDAIQTAVHRQCEAMERPSALTLRRGPITASAQEEATLELFGIVAGSTGLLFRYAKPQQPLPIPERMDFGTEVLTRVAETIKQFERQKPPAVETDAGVLDSLSQLGEVLQRRTITRIKLNVPAHNGKSRTIRATVNAAVFDRISALAATFPLCGYSDQKNGRGMAADGVGVGLVALCPGGEARQRRRRRTRGSAAA